MLDERAAEIIAESFRYSFDTVRPATVYKILEAYESAKGNDGWQPIETAPKDGSEILVFSPERPEGKGVTVVFWKNEAWAFLDAGELQLNIEDCLTHWMPLPTAPALSAGEVAGTQVSPPSLIARHAAVPGASE